MPARVPRVTRTEAIVLRHRRLGDADRIVTLLTPERGKLDAVAKGTLRPKSRLAGHLEPLVQTEVLLAHGRSLDIVTQAQMIEGFGALHADLERLSTGMYVAELADRMTVEHADARDVYDLLLATLVRLSRGDGVHIATRTFEMDLLSRTGFRPEWRSCIGCGEMVSAERATWSALGGGVVCPRCRERHDDAVAIDSTALKVLRAIQDGPYEDAGRIRLSPELAGRLERVMHTMVQSVSERGLATAQFVADARRLVATAPSVAPYTQRSLAEGD
ncbi:MAG: DNA repair protein RecO [Dehalococcoidia bacterium]